jgi:hypothetical protein
MSTVPVFATHDSMVWTQRQPLLAAHPLGELVSGDKKDVVISNLIYSTPNRVCIYGWIQTNGAPIQPLTNVHADTYMDYSHGIRLVQDTCMLDGTTVTTIQNVLESSTLNPILSDEGTIAQPWYPYFATSALELSEDDLQILIYPNPNNGKFQIQDNNHQLIANSQIEIYNVMGEKVFHSTIQLLNNSIIELKEVNVGMYFLYLKTKQGIATQKFIITK